MSFVRRRTLGPGARVGPITTTPYMWLKADAGTSTTTDGVGVATWSDQSGHGRNATQATGANQPLYKTAIQNGLPILRFLQASQQFFALPTLAALTQGAIFIVVKAPVAGTALWKIGTTGAINYYPYTDTHIYDDCGSTVRQDEGVAPSLAGFNVYEISSAAGAWTSWLNGTQQFTTATNTVGFNSVPTLGKAGGYFTGDVGELLLYPGPLTAGDRTTVRTYLKVKWATP